MKALFQSEELQILVHWIRERDLVRARREAGLPRPWTDDPLLLDYRWCNVRRMDDKVSKWLMGNWYVSIRGSENQIYAALLGRLINWPESLERIREVFPDMGKMMSALKAYREAGNKVFTGAYVIPGSVGEEKVETILRRARNASLNFPTTFPPTTMKEAWECLVAFEGIGSFLAGQVVADLAYLDCGRAWPDRETWAPLGPGSARGINRLQGKPKNTAINQAEFEMLLPALCEILRPKVCDIWDDRHLVAMDIQNSLCEYDKYRRLALDEGQVRSRYDGRGKAAQASLL